MRKKILVIDDSALMRRVLSDIINADDKLTVSDMACSGMQALEFLVQGKRYDIILVDIQMPKMDGIEFLKAMQRNEIDIPVLVVSSAIRDDPDKIMEALELGALDFVEKPAGTVGKNYAEFHDSILAKVYPACGLGIYPAVARNLKSNVGRGLQKNVPPAKKKTFSAVSGHKLAFIASSTGGPKALQSVVPLFPADFPYPLVVVQHMPAGFTKSLAERLDQLSNLRVKEAADGEILQRGVAYIAQGGKQCELVQQSSEKYSLSVNDKPPRGGLRPCADIFLESLVDTSFEEIVCGVLTGMGSDATMGILQLKKHKKVKVAAQDEATCVVYGMPRAAYVAGVVDERVPLEKVAGTMLKQLGV
jgi:two-component system chemotaxis response regulator CheB